MTDYFTQATISPCLPAALFSDEEINAMELAFGLTCDKIGSELYFFADTAFSEQGEDEDGEEVSLIDLLQTKLRMTAEDEYPQITIQGCSWCGKMRPDQFSGFAYHITRDKWRHLSTMAWLDRVSTKAIDTSQSTD